MNKIKNTTTKNSINWLWMSFNIKVFFHFPGNGKEKVFCGIRPWFNIYKISLLVAPLMLRATQLISNFLSISVISTYREPVRGWIDNVYGPIGMMVGAGTGVLHTHLLNLDNVIDMVPVDLVVNAVIASAWNIQAAKSEKTESPRPIDHQYNR